MSSLAKSACFGDSRRCTVHSWGNGVLPYCKFWIYTHPVNSKLTIWQYKDWGRVCIRPPHLTILYRCWWFREMARDPCPRWLGVMAVLLAPGTVFVWRPDPKLTSLHRADQIDRANVANQIFINTRIFTIIWQKSWAYLLSL